MIKRYGGADGIRDEKLLSSSLAQLRMKWGGKHLHATIFDKASAYGFHLCRNHPFIDGNKRIAFMTMYVFLFRNGWELDAEEKQAYAMIIELAEGKLTKKQLAQWLKANCTKR